MKKWQLLNSIGFILFTAVCVYIGIKDYTEEPAAKQIVIEKPECPGYGEETCPCFFKRVSTPEGRRTYMGHEDIFPCTGPDAHTVSKCCKPGGGRR